MTFFELPVRRTDWRVAADAKYAAREAGMAWSKRDVKAEKERLKEHLESYFLCLQAMIYKSQQGSHIWLR